MKNGLIRLGFLAATLLLFSTPAFALTKTWTGLGASDNASDCNNWNSSTCPSVGTDAIVFNVTSKNNAHNNCTWNTAYNPISMTIGSNNTTSTYSGVITVTTADTISGTLTFRNGTLTLNQSSGTFVVTDNFLMPSGGTGVLNLNNQSMKVGTSIATTGSIAATSTPSGVAAGTIHCGATDNTGCTAGTMTLAHTSAELLGATSATFYNLTCWGNGGTTTLTSGITVLGALTIGGAAGSNTKHTFDTSTGNYAVTVTNNINLSGGSGANTSIFNANGSAIQCSQLVIGNALNTALLGTFNANASTLTLTGGDTGSILITHPLSVWSGGNVFSAGTSKVIMNTAATVATDNSTTYYDLTINGSGTFSSNGALTVSDNLAVNTGTLDVGTNNLTVGSAGSGGWISGTGTITQNSANSTTLAGPSSGINIGDSVNTDSVSGCSGTMAGVTLGAVSLTSSVIIWPCTSVTFTSLNIGTGSAYYDGSTGTTTTLSGSGTGANAPFIKSGTFSNLGGKIKYTGSSTTDVTSTTYSNLEVNGTGPYNAAGNITVKNNLTVTQGTLAMGANNLNVGVSGGGGSTSISVASNASLTQSASGTTTFINYTGATAGTISGGSGTGSVSFYNLSIAPTLTGNSNYTLGDAAGQTIAVGNNFTIGDGNASHPATVSAATNDPTINVTGGVTINAGTTFTATDGSMTVGGSWTNSGTFNAGTGTVTFNGTTQTINNANTWYNLAVTGSAARTVSFQSSVAQTIAANGSLTLTGASGQILTLAPVTAATNWQLHLDPTATQNVSYVSTSYSDAGPFGTYQEINASDGTSTYTGASDTNTNWNWHLDSTNFLVME